MSIKVAIFDDNNNIRNSIVLLLSTAPGIAVVGSFRDALHCVENVRACRPDVVLMDIEMPGVNGIEALRKIKDVFPEVSVLMQTVFEDDDRVWDSIKAGATGYIIKATLTQSLVDALHDMQSGNAPMTPWVARKVLNLVHAAQDSRKQAAYYLTTPEKDVLTRIINGQSYKTIAAELSISPDVVREYIKTIYERLHLDSLALIANPSRRVRW